MTNKNKNVTYEQARKYLADKDLCVDMFCRGMLSRTAQMFEYDGLPDSIPKRELEMMLQWGGEVFITKVNDELYAFEGGAGGEPDAYYRPTIFTVANPALQLSKEYKIGVDGVRVLNDSQHLGIMPTLEKYAVLATDTALSFDTALVLSRITMLISAPDDKTKASADNFVTKILSGDFSVIGDSAFFDGVKMQTPATGNSSIIQQLIEAVQFVKASCYNELGIGAEYNLKRERLNLAEVEQTNSGLIPFVFDMLQCRRLYFKQVNEMFGTSISVDFSSVWMNDANIETEPQQDGTEPQQDGTEPQQDGTEPQQDGTSYED